MAPLDLVNKGDVCEPEQLPVGLDVDDTQYRRSAFDKVTVEVIDSKCRLTLKGLLTELDKLQQKAPPGQANHSEHGYDPRESVKNQHDAAAMYPDSGRADAVRRPETTVSRIFATSVPRTIDLA